MKSCLLIENKNYLFCFLFFILYLCGTHILRRAPSPPPPPWGGGVEGRKQKNKSSPPPGGGDDPPLLPPPPPLPFCWGGGKPNKARAKLLFKKGSSMSPSLSSCLSVTSLSVLIYPGFGYVHTGYTPDRIHPYVWFLRLL